MRVYELARELGLESKEVLEQAEELGLDVSTASSGLSDEGAELLRLAFSPDGETEAEVFEEAAEPEAAEAVVAEEPETAEPAAVKEPETPVPAADVDIAYVDEGASVADFANAIGQATGEVVKALLERGIPAGANQAMPPELIDEIAEGFGYIVEIEEAEAPPVVAPQPTFEDADEDLVSRPPVVTVMGHVDHGKTTLLDKIRQAHVVDEEQGGITQHIGAYQVEVNERKITFIDTPGHEAFTALRARGANITDIVVLVVAADDGVMPQTVEAISHAKAAGVKMIVAINKMDLPAADPLRVRTELTNHGIVTEDLGGDVPGVELSAVTGRGLDDLLEVIDLIAQLEDFKANPEPMASGVVVEAQLEKGRGPVATVIIQRGTLEEGDPFVAGSVAGRVRALLDDQGGRIKSAGPATPVQIMGWNGVPTAGDFFRVMESDRDARDLAAERQEEDKLEAHVAPSARERLEGLLDQLRSEDATLNVIVKADAQGSLEALRESIGKIEREGGKIQIIHTAVGGVSENDVTLAEVTESVIVGFNVRPEPKARKAAEEAGVEIRTYGVIYELLDEIELLLVGQLAPDEEEVVLGTAEVRALFRVPRAGTVAGCYVVEGVVQRGAKARLLRNGVVVHDGVISSLKRFKDDVREVASGFE
ncbi:MAG: translation initiation factor IF-2, partial [Actinobacteria bacterium]|nr:translation initiation factor IF-2 [Actinomycetota bacterium]